MNRAIIAALLLLFNRSSNVIAQTNLVLNGDFEQYDYCPQSYDGLGVKYWTGIDTVGLGQCDPIDYCNVCANSLGMVGIPQGKLYYQYPHSGNAFMELVLYCDDGSGFDFWMHYLQGRLSKTLTAGKKYCVSFWVCMAEGSKYAIKDISAYLDNGTIDTARWCGAPQTQYTPQITNKGGIITDTVNWIKIEGSFVARGDEQFITIGNYKNRLQTTKATLPTNSYSSSFPYYGMYLVDDVSVTECSVGIDNTARKYEEYTLAPNPGKGAITISQSIIEDTRAVNIALLEVTGKMIYHSTLHFKRGNATLDLSSLAPAVYFLKLSDAERGSSLLRFIKE